MNFLLCLLFIVFKVDQLFITFFTFLACHTSWLISITLMITSFPVASRMIQLSNKLLCLCILFFRWFAWAISSGNRNFIMVTASFEELIGQIQCEWRLQNLCLRKVHGHLWGSHVLWVSFRFIRDRRRLNYSLSSLLYNVLIQFDWLQPILPSLLLHSILVLLHCCIILNSDE